MIRTFERKTGNSWNEVVIINTETNDFTQFCYEIINGKLLRFSEHVTTANSKYPINCKDWFNHNRKWFKYEEVENNFLDGYPAWNPATDLTEEIKKERRIYA